MIITEKDIMESFRRIALNESLQKASEGVFTDESVDMLIEGNYDFRRALITTMIQDVDPSFVGENFYYVERQDGRLNLLDLDNMGKEYGTLIKGIKGIVTTQINGNTRGATVANLDYTSMGKHGIAYPKEFDTKPPLIIYVNIDLIKDMEELIDAGSFMWTLTHEIHHHYPSYNTNETEVQKRTFDWLLENDYYDTIGKSLLNQVFFVKGENLTNSYINREVLNHMIKGLKSIDKLLYIDLLLGAEEALNHPVMGDARGTKKALVWIEEEIESNTWYKLWIKQKKEETTWTKK